MRETLNWAYEHDSKVNFFKVLDSAEKLPYYEWDSLIDYAKSICKNWVMEWLCME